MKNKIITAIVFLCLLFPMVSCAPGVSQEDYARLSSQLATAQAQIRSLQGELSTKESQIEAATQKLDGAKARMEIINALFITVFKGEKEALGQDYVLEWGERVTAIGDPTLTGKFESVLSSGGANEALDSLFVYLFESTAKLLK